jgi:hypothetical protein
MDATSLYEISENLPLCINIPRKFFNKFNFVQTDVNLCIKNTTSKFKSMYSAKQRYKICSYIQTQNNQMLETKCSSAAKTMPSQPLSVNFGLLHFRYQCGMSTAQFF